MNAWTFKENVENEFHNLAESALNKLLFLSKQEFIDNGVSDEELSQVKITINIERIL